MLSDLMSTTGSLYGVACVLEALPDGVLINLASFLPLPDRLHLAQTSKKLRCRLHGDEKLWNRTVMSTHRDSGYFPSKLRGASRFLQARAPSGCHVAIYMSEVKPDPAIWTVIGDELLPLAKTLLIHIDYEHYDGRGLHDPQILADEGFANTVMDRFLMQPSEALHTLSIRSGSSDHCGSTIYLPALFLGGTTASGSLRDLRLEEIRLSGTLNYPALSSVVRFDYAGGQYSTLPLIELQAINCTMPQLEELGLDFSRLEQAPSDSMAPSTLREVWILNFGSGSSGLLTEYFHLVPTITIRPIMHTDDLGALQWPSSTFDLTLNAEGGFTVRTSHSYHRRVTIHLTDLERAIPPTQRNRVVSITFAELWDSSYFPVLSPLPGVTLLRIVVSPCRDGWSSNSHLCSVFVNPSMLGDTLHLFPALDRVEIIHNTTRSSKTADDGCRWLTEYPWPFRGRCCCSATAVISLSVIADFLQAIIPHGQRISLLRFIGMDYVTDGEVVDALRRLAEMVDVVDGAAHDTETKQIVKEINTQVIAMSVIPTNLERSLKGVFVNSWLI